MLKPHHEQALRSLESEEARGALDELIADMQAEPIMLWRVPRRHGAPLPPLQHRVERARCYYEESTDACSKEIRIVGANSLRTSRTHLMTRHLTRRWSNQWPAPLKFFMTRTPHPAARRLSPVVAHLVLVRCRGRHTSRATSGRSVGGSCGGPLFFFPGLFYAVSAWAYDCDSAGISL